MAFNTLQSVSLLVGRLLLCAIFLGSGIGKLFDLSGTQAYMTSAGLPATGILLAMAIFAEVAGGISLLSGFLARVGAGGLIVFLIPATFLFHHFWSMPEDQATVQMHMFMKNLAIMGGLFYVLAAGAGPISVDGLLAKKK